MTRRRARRADVAIVGAGLAGLTAARAFVRAALGSRPTTKARTCCFLNGRRSTFPASIGVPTEQPLLNEIVATIGKSKTTPPEPWNRGGPSVTLSPEVLSDFGSAIRDRLGRVHWAGSETSTFWAGYMDGAVRSGERAAAEVLAKL